MQFNPASTLLQAAYKKSATPSPKAPMPESQHDVDALNALKDQLNAKDHEFAVSLIKGNYGFYGRGFISVKQHGWVKVLLEKAMFPEEKVSVPKELVTPKMAQAAEAKKAIRGAKHAAQSQSVKDKAKNQAEGKYADKS